MVLIDTQLTASEVLRVFRHDEPYLLLGAAFTTVSIVAVAFCAIRRRLDALLVSLAVFALLYGQRLWLDSRLLHLTIPPSEFFDRLISVVDYLVPIPAFLFFQAAGFLGKRGKGSTIALVSFFSTLVLIAAIHGDSHPLRFVNNAVVMAAMLTMLIILLRRKGDRDFSVVRIGLVSFGVLVLIDNAYGRMMLEPFGFAMLLASLGYVATRRALKREEEYGEVRKELEVAQRIQLSLLPAAYPESSAFRVAARYVPVTSVAGDFYDFVIAEKDRAGLLIADVSGHGVPAALIASMVKMAAIAQRAHAESPAWLLTEMNRALCGNTQGQYVTAAYVYLDARGKTLRYAAAGHPPMLLLRNGAVMEVAENGLLLAAADGVSYSELSMPLQPGDRLLLYTDGITEARGADGGLFGEDALKALLQSTGVMSVAQATDRIVDHVRGWSRTQEDDLTVVICDYAS